MTEESSHHEAVWDEAQDKIERLGETIEALVDEKHDLMTANERLAHELKAVIAEKDDLQRKLAGKEGLGIQQQHNDEFAKLKDTAKGFRDITPPRPKPEGDNL